VLTNSLAATDEPLVHTGYARYRPRLLAAGVDVYELSPERTRRSKRLGMFGSSFGRLHAKTAVVDGRTVFIGSMNLDPRSAFLNTEMGVLVDSPELAAQVRELFERTTSPELSYRVVVEDGEGLVWYDRVKGQDRRLEREPDASAGRRLAVTLLRLLPIDSLL
jgi:putative cardiolipin synthase